MIYSAQEHHIKNLLDIQVDINRLKMKGNKHNLHKSRL